jgi:hypothetical protein
MEEKEDAGEVTGHKNSVKRVTRDIKRVINDNKRVINGSLSHIKGH